MDAPETGERFEVLHARSGVRIERIVSSASPDQREHDQDHDEWVLLVAGSATLEVEGEPVDLAPGDHLVLPAHRRHRVVRTEAGTTWLAVHFEGSPSPDRGRTSRPTVLEPAAGPGMEDVG